MATMIKSNSVQSTKKALIKFCKTVPVSNQKVRGTFTITGYRKYSCWEEVDVQFQGEICVRLGVKPATWFDTSVKSMRISKVKLNRFLRKSLEKEVELRAKYFSVKLGFYGNIKKIKWV